MARWVKSKQLMQIFKTATTPVAADGIRVGDLWIDTTTAAVAKICTAITPAVTFDTISIGTVSGYTATATAAGTTTLTASSNSIQDFTGTTTQTVVMPVASTLTVGETWKIINNSTGVVTVQYSGLNTIIAMPADTAIDIWCILASGTGVASWDYKLSALSNTTTGTGNLVRHTSPTLVTPALGTPASGVLTNATGLPLTTGVTGTLPVANGGTGVTTSTGTGNTVLSTSPTLVTPALGTPASGVLTSCTGLPMTTGVTGTLPVANGGTGVTSSTGTVATVLSTSPTLVTPVLGAASATSIDFTSTSEIIGTTTNDNAAAGSVGEFVSSVIAAASAVSATTNTPNNITSISLTAGDWDLFGNVSFDGGATTNVTYLQGWLGTIGASTPDASLRIQVSYPSGGTVPFVNGAVSQTVPFARLSIAGTNTVYLSFQAGFTVSTLTVCGGLFARRAR